MLEQQDVLALGIAAVVVQVARPALRLALIGQCLLGTVGDHDARVEPALVRDERK